MTAPLASLPLADVRFGDGFLGARVTTNREVTIPLVWSHCRRSGRIGAFDLGWTPGRPHRPHVFWDSDVAKWVEAACYSLAAHPDRGLRRKVDDVVRRIIAAQRRDGYLNVHFTVVAPKKRWTNLRDHHELYCAGHLIEAAVARAEALGEDDLLQAMRRYTDLIGRTFGRRRGQKRGYPGHQEIELALVRLSSLTGEPEPLDLARYFLDERGRTPHFFDREARARGEDPREWRFGRTSYDYCQAHLPVREQREAVGHAVRALYMMSAMVDVGAATGDRTLLTASRRLWESVAQRRMYVTGGIGSSSLNEGFTHDHDLPEEHGYAETCASVAFVFLCQRLLQVTRDGRYADALERALYNGVLSGVSLGGDRFFYGNPLASHDPGDPDGEAGTIWDGPSRHRQVWFGCACCPPNLARLLASLGRYAASMEPSGLWLHLYERGTFVQGAFDEPLVVRVDTEYPWDGTVDLTLEAVPERDLTLHLRIPGWCRQARLRAADEHVDLAAVTRKGYAHLRRRWQSGDRIRLDLVLPVERIRAHPAVRQASGRVALQRGPLVYCLETADNPVEPLDRIVLPRHAQLRAEPSPELGGIVAIEGEAEAVQTRGWKGDTLYAPRSHATEKVAIRAVPYCLWDNRSRGSMRVWLRE